METLQAKVTSKGQVTLPKKIRESLSIKTGDYLEFSVESGNHVSLRKMQAAGSSAGCGRPFIQHSGIPPTIEKMDESIRTHLKQKFGRSSAKGS